ncbi:hypothetical protein HEK616_71570 [Streptomyces nigrescens]|uniref:Uncharacterized protein n=1 Tax=Streptomyces nigrescens TaxID=1920 RepID=A0ABM8A4X3_STRNI|nr:hypothetical protein HEK616_71570 [Streptomyces nigrescens]
MGMNASPTGLVPTGMDVTARKVRTGAAVRFTAPAPATGGAWPRRRVVLRSSCDGD